MKIPPKLSLILALSLSAALIQSSNLCQLKSRAEAPPKSEYVPPATDARPQRLISGGSRGCKDSVNASLTLLVPPSHLPTTSSSHPTFFLHLENIPTRPLLFTVVEPGIVEPVFEQKLTLKQSGLVPIKLPESSRGLEAGKEYYWTVSIPCNQKRPSQNAYARAAIKRISLPARIAEKLISNPDNLEKARIYAQSGIWYDALATSYQAYSQAPPQSPINAYFWQLLAQIGLKDLREN